jgi:hypothetical protein
MQRTDDYASILQPYIPRTIGEIRGNLDSMMLFFPTFKDERGYFSGQNIETEFFALNEGFKVM